MCHQKCTLEIKQQKNPWYKYQSNSYTKMGYCKQKLCPGNRRKLIEKKNQSYKTHMWYDECTVINNGTNKSFCNTTKIVVVVLFLCNQCVEFLFN